MTIATVVVIHPDAPRPPSLALIAARRAALDHSKIRKEITLHHTTLADLIADADCIRRHAQALLDRYALPGTKDVTIFLIPCRPNSDTDRFGGMFGSWRPDAHGADELWLSWATATLDPALPVLTHELGHHLRGAEADQTLYSSHRVSLRLLHEGVAERLVLDVHGEQALHHRQDCAGVIHAYLHPLLLKERDDTTLDSYHHMIWEGIAEGGEIYPPATHLMLASGLSLRQLLRTPVRTYLDLILPLVTTLPHEATEP